MFLIKNVYIVISFFAAVIKWPYTNRVVGLPLCDASTISSTLYSKGVKSIKNISDVIYGRLLLHSKFILVSSIESSQQMCLASNSIDSAASCGQELYQMTFFVLQFFLFHLQTRARQLVRINEVRINEVRINEVLTQAPGRVWATMGIGLVWCCYRAACQTQTDVRAAQWFLETEKLSAGRSLWQLKANLCPKHLFMLIP